VRYTKTIGNHKYSFESLKEMLAKASPERSGDALAGVTAKTGEERVAAQMALAETYLSDFLKEEIIPYDNDEVTRVIFDHHNKSAFERVSTLTVGEFRNWLLLDETDSLTLKEIAPGLIPEMAAAVSKIMRN
jgi:ethanolamine ammonia-lyase large subunit